MATDMKAEDWRGYGGIIAFVGNELLTPMNRSNDTRGLAPEFWATAPVPDSGNGREGLSRLAAYAGQAASTTDVESIDLPGMLAASVEFTHLFIGPPSPAADPWETANGANEQKHSGYGRATLEMRELIAAEQLAMENSNNQMEDHIGIELLYLSVLCERAAEGADGGVEEPVYPAKAHGFIAAHPLSWIERLRTKADAARPGGYYSALLQYVQGVLEDLYRDTQRAA